MATKGGRRNALQQETNRLFELPPGSFVAARDELARRLKGEGRSAEAAEVRSLRRPTVAAWAVNQVARRHPEDVTELLAAGAALRQAQRKMMSGVKAGGFRQAMERRRRVVTRLSNAAEEILRDSGHGSPGVLDAISATFEAASLDESTAEQVRAGRLSKEVAAPAGFGPASGLELIPGGAGTEEKPSKPDHSRQDAAREARSLANAAGQARRQAIKAREEADRAEAKADRLKQEAEAARIEAREASRWARDRESEATRAQSEADRAARRAERP